MCLYSGSMSPEEQVKEEEEEEEDDDEKDEGEEEDDDINFATVLYDRQDEERNLDNEEDSSSKWAGIDINLVFSMRVYLLTDCSSRRNENTRRKMYLDKKDGRGTGRLRLRASETWSDANLSDKTADGPLANPLEGKTVPRKRTKLLAQQGMKIRGTSREVFHTYGLPDTLLNDLEGFLPTNSRPVASIAEAMAFMEP
ncbi:hypothetical protein EAI_02857 [Harpegnathos saltator]|uniref:Uncharacterized protein n=1 Tax=Harpegnathos saltator TaxID=610380 RepID=E2C6S2_HARSA|nr:hypothetical protein EAI_02857 [Harpegnathos saltator]